jgi:hypothetical protein
MTSSSPANDENMTQSPPPLMGEGEGGGEQLSSFPPHLNPLPPGERNCFLRNPNVQWTNDRDEVVSDFEFGDWSLTVI